MIDTIDKRLTDLEGFMTDLPEILNIRHERVDLALRENGRRFDEMAGRLSLLDRQMAMMMRDLRDMRGGVTRQLIGQDHAIAELKIEFKADVAGLKTDVAGLKTDVAGLKTDVAGLKGDVAELKLGVTEILARLPQRGS